MRIVWIESARTDLEDIYVFINEKNEKAAIEIHNGILNEIGLLSSFPQIAAIDPALTDLSKTYRSLIVKNIYKVIYYIDDNTVYIIAVWDCRRNPNNLKRKIKKN
jgi:plasmid stabilization system protein ParE